jgi:hypothetical protein
MIEEGETSVIVFLVSFGSVRWSETKNGLTITTRATPEYTAGVVELADDDAFYLFFQEKQIFGVKSTTNIVIQNGFLQVGRSLQQNVKMSHERIFAETPNSAGVKGPMQRRCIIRWAINKIAKRGMFDTEKTTFEASGVGTLG